MVSMDTDEQGLAARTLLTSESLQTKLAAFGGDLSPFSLGFVPLVAIHKWKPSLPKANESIRKAELYRFELLSNEVLFHESEQVKSDPKTDHSAKPPFCQAVANAAESGVHSRMFIEPKY